METYRIHDEVKEWAFSLEMPTTAVTGHPYLTHVSTLAVFNKTGSGKLVRVRQLKAEKIFAQTTKTAVPTNAGIRRITAHTVTDEIMPAYKIDSNNADLPSQVVCCRRPASITTSGGVMENICLSPAANETRALGSFCSRMMLSDLHDIAYQWESDSGGDNQKIVLREGEGIALDTANITNAYPHWLEIGVSVRNASSGACYRYKFHAFISPRPIFSLLNGSGSGVVLEVFRITAREIGTDVMPNITAERIDSIDETTGYTATADPFDTANSIDSNIVVRGNVKVTIDGHKRGAFMVIPHLAYKNGTGRGVGPGLAGFLPQFHDHFHTSQPFGTRYPHEDLYDICLREGEGLGFFQRNASGQMYSDPMMQITVEGVTGGYPPENKVENSYVYGPNEEYTGSLAGGGGTVHPIIGGAIVRVA